MYDDVETSATSWARRAAATAWSGRSSTPIPKRSSPTSTLSWRPAGRARAGSRTTAQPSRRERDWTAEEIEKIAAAKRQIPWLARFPDTPAD
jgi:hypothetical protein